MPALNGSIGVGAILRSGVYLLVFKGEVVYVGKSKVVLRRLYEHRSSYLAFRQKRNGSNRATRVFAFDDVWVYPCEYHDLDRMEQELIAKHCPRYNIVHKRKAIEGPIELQIEGMALTLNGPVVAEENERRA